MALASQSDRWTVSHGPELTLKRRALLAVSSFGAVAGVRPVAAATSAELTIGVHG